MRTSPGKTTTNLNMKMRKTLFLVAVAAATFTTSQNLRATVFSPSDLNNRAVANSPRAKEQFPWLARQSAPQAKPTPNAKSALSAIKKNRSLATSPRMLEQFPELARGEQSATVATAKSSSGESQLANVIRNPALAHSPRMIEQFPELARSYAAQPAKMSFEEAPLK